MSSTIVGRATLIYKHVSCLVDKEHQTILPTYVTIDTSRAEMNERQQRGPKMPKKRQSV